MSTNIRGGDKKTTNYLEILTKNRFLPSHVDATDAPLSIIGMGTSYLGFIKLCE